MTASEILADNLRRLMQGQESLDWAGDAVTSYHVDQALDGAHMVLVQDLQNIASAAGVEPWQLLAPLCGRAAWSPNPHGSLSLRTLPDCGRVGSIMVYTHTVMSEVPGRDPVMAHHATEAEARAAVEAALFEVSKS